MDKVAVIGAGISGLSVARMLQSEGTQVVLFEKDFQVGGLVSCTKESGVLFHRVGGHVFNSRNQEVLDWFWSIVSKDEFCPTKRNAKIWMNNSLIGYPIENFIYRFDKETVEKIIDELLRINNVTSKSYANFEDFLKGNFGKTLYELYFKPYNDKVWKIDLSEVPLPWLEGKLPMPNVREIFINNILKAEESTMVHSQFFYPKMNGSQYIADRLAEGLDVRFNKLVTQINKVEDCWIVDGEQFDTLIYTGDVRALESLLSDEIFPKSIKNKLSSLKSNGTSNVLCETDLNDMSWQYFPEAKYKPHRIIYTGNFSPLNNGSVSRSTCTIEFSGYLSEEALSKEVEKLPGNNVVLAYNYEPNSYVVHTFDTDDIIDEVKHALVPQNFHLLGRFAEWKYYNMDKAMEAGMELLKQLKIN